MGWILRVALKLAMGLYGFLLLLLLLLLETSEAHPIYIDNSHNSSTEAFEPKPSAEANNASIRVGLDLIDRSMINILDKGEGEKTDVIREFEIFLMVLTITFIKAALWLYLQTAKENRHLLNRFLQMEPKMDLFLNGVGDDIDSPLLPPEACPLPDVSPATGRDDDTAEDPNINTANASQQL